MKPTEIAQALRDEAGRLAAKAWAAQEPLVPYTTIELGNGAKITIPTAHLLATVADYFQKEESQGGTGW